ncbi:aldo/keto reductase [Apiospora arundinis]
MENSDRKRKREDSDGDSSVQVIKPEPSEPAVINLDDSDNGDNKSLRKSPEAGPAGDGNDDALPADLETLAVVTNRNHEMLQDLMKIPEDLREEMAVKTSAVKNDMNMNIVALKKEMAESFDETMRERISNHNHPRLGKLEKKANGIDAAVKALDKKYDKKLKTVHNETAKNNAVNIKAEVKQEVNERLRGFGAYLAQFFENNDAPLANAGGNVAGNMVGSLLGNGFEHQIGNEFGTGAGNPVENRLGNGLENSNGNPGENPDENRPDNTTGDRGESSNGNHPDKSIGNRLGNSVGNRTEDSNGNRASNGNGNKNIDSDINTRDNAIARGSRSNRSVQEQGSSLRAFGPVSGTDDDAATRAALALPTPSLSDAAPRRTICSSLGNLSAQPTHGGAGGSSGRVFRGAAGSIFGGVLGDGADAGAGGSAGGHALARSGRVACAPLIPAASAATPVSFVDARSFLPYQVLTNKGYRTMLEKIQWTDMTHIVQLLKVDNSKIARRCTMFNDKFTSHSIDYVLQTGLGVRQIGDVFSEPIRVARVGGHINQPGANDLLRNQNLKDLRLMRMKIKSNVLLNEEQVRYKKWQETWQPPAYVYDLGELMLRKRATRMPYALTAVLTQYNLLLEVNKEGSPNNRRVWVAMAREYQPTRKRENASKDSNLPFNGLEFTKLALLAHSVRDLEFDRFDFSQVAGGFDLANQLVNESRCPGLPDLDFDKNISLRQMCIDLA